MDSVSSMLAAGLHARTEALDLIANNIANAAAAGFKADREAFSSYLSADAATALEQGQSAAMMQMPMIEKQVAELSQGALQPTGNPTDLALEGPGFFGVETPNGKRYTRAGAFHLAADGELRTVEGFRVRVIQTQTPDRLGADPGKPLRVERNGELWQDEQRLGTIERVRFSRPDLLQKEGQLYFKAAQGMETTPANTSVSSGTLESSNVDIARNSMRLIESTRTFQMLNRAISIHSSMGRNLVDQVAKW